MILQCDGITKSFGSTLILADVSLKVEAGERLGLVGVNGAGKSTLLSILAGLLPADEGTIITAREARVGYQRQDSGLETDNTIGEELLSVFAPLVQAQERLRAMEAELEAPSAHDDVAAYEALMERYVALSDWHKLHGGFDVESQIASVLGGLGLAGLPRDRVISGLSGGQKTRLALAKLLLERPDVLLLDEPTNHLDFPALAWLEGYLKTYPGAVLIVSHDRYFLDALVTAVCEIERTRLTRWTGNYSRFVELKAQEREVQRKHWAQQQEEIARTEDWIERHRVRATSARAAQSRIKALERIERLERPEAELKTARFTFRAGDPPWLDVLQVRDLQIGVGSPEARKVLLRGVNLSLRRGDRVGIIGANGIGKSTLLKTLVGRHEADCGELHWGEKVRLGFYDQEQCDLDADLTILQQLRHWFPRLPEERLRSVLGCFLFSGEDVLKPTPALSGGERARVALARLMLLEANVLVLDEPTNHLDLASKEMLEAALQGYDGTLAFVSHSRYFLNRLARRIIEITPTGLEVYEGNFDYYAARKEEAAAAAAQTSVAEVGQPQYQSAERREFVTARRTQREEEIRLRKVAALEQRIEQLEAAIALVEESMADPAVATNPAVLAQRYAVVQSRRAELQQCYAEWEELAADE